MSSTKSELMREVIAGRNIEVYCDTKLGLINITAIRELFAKLQRERGTEPAMIPLNPNIADWIKQEGDIEEARVAEVDYNDPLIAVDIGTEDAPYVVPIDGFHRITKAFREGVFTLPFWHLTKALVDKYFLVTPDMIGRMPKWGRDDHPADKMVDAIIAERDNG
jgi:hypothetical protein